MRLSEKMLHLDLPPALKAVTLVCAIFSCILFVGCSSIHPAGRAPADVGMNFHNNEQCTKIIGTFSSNAKGFRNGVQLTHLENQVRGESITIGHLVSGCHEPSECRWPLMRKSAAYFNLQVGTDEGLRIELFDSEKSSLGLLQLPASRMACTNHGLTATLHNGLAQDGAGAWTIGHEKLTIDLVATPEGKLVARRTSERFDVFWFGLPVSSEEGAWFIFERIK